MRILEGAANHNSISINQEGATVSLVPHKWSYRDKKKNIVPLLILLFGAANW
jgi:hypothetical protein